MRENLCVSCNNAEGYYPKSDDPTRADGFVNCYKNLLSYYLLNDTYEPCYLSCKYCSGSGNSIDNKCTECLPEYETKIDFENDTNCYLKCPHNYYYDENNNYTCTGDNNCPSEYSKLITTKKRCIDLCKNDNIYRYEYLNKCYKQCPSGTESTVNDTFICKEVTKERCKLRKEIIKTNDVTANYINNLTVDYVNQYGSSLDYVSKQENNIYTIYIYKDITCLQRTAGEAPQIDFGECYQKIKDHYIIEDDELIITLINKREDNNPNPSTSFLFSHPQSGIILEVSEVCSDEKIVIQEDVLSIIEQLDDKKEEYIKFLTNQGIDVFNISDEFYNDLCFPYESPNGKDVPMKDRITAFYPNVTLCDKGCENKGVNLDTMKAKCECIFNSFMDNEMLMENFYGQAIAEVMDILSSLNIAVVQCIMDILNGDQFSKCTGGYIILGLLFGQLIFILIYLCKGLYAIRKHMFSLSHTYEAFLQNHHNEINNIIFAPPKKKISKPNLRNNNTNGRIDNYSVQSSESIKIVQNNILKKKQNGSSTDKSSATNLNKKRISINKIGNKKINKLILPKNLGLNKYANKKLKIVETTNKQEVDKIKDFLSNSFDENDFDDAYDKDKRKFCQYFCEKFQNDQLFIKAFFIHEILKPRALKCLILVITIELYFAITALFYNEDYLSQLFNSEEEDEGFFDFVPRRLNQFIYTSAVSGFITYLMGYFFVEEIKIKKIFLRNKEEMLKIKYELSVLADNIGKKFTTLIIFCLILSIVCFVYICCFNIVYPYIRGEWIKSSVFILILMQIINLILTFAHCCIRFMGLRCNSVKIFKLSQWLS